MKLIIHDETSDDHCSSNILHPTNKGNSEIEEVLAAECVVIQSFEQITRRQICEKLFSSDI